MSFVETFAQRLRMRGYRLTPQREMILNVLHRMDGLVTAEEIFERVKAISAAVDISTVYRTLDLFHELQMISSLELGDGQSRYEFVGEKLPHHHILCSGCGELVWVEPEELDPLAHHFQKKHGYEVDLGSITFRGLCQSCAAKGSETSHLGR